VDLVVGGVVVVVPMWEKKKRVMMFEGGRCIGGGQPLRSAIRFKFAFSW
jgi:hypothetical protein